MVQRAPPQERVEDGVVGEDGGGEAKALGEVGNSEDVTPVFINK